VARGSPFEAGTTGIIYCHYGMNTYGTSNYGMNLGFVSHWEQPFLIDYWLLTIYERLNLAGPVGPEGRATVHGSIKSSLHNWTNMRV